MTKFERLILALGRIYDSAVYQLPDDKQEEVLAMLQDGRLIRGRGFSFHKDAGKGDENITDSEAIAMILKVVPEIQEERRFFTVNYLSKRLPGVGPGRVERLLEKMVVDGEIYPYLGAVSANTKQEPYTLYPPRQSILRALGRGVMDKTGLRNATGFVKVPDDDKSAQIAEAFDGALSSLEEEGLVIKGDMGYMLCETAPVRRRIKRR